jgi:hypothetical protein
MREGLATKSGVAMRCGRIAGAKHGSMRRAKAVINERRRRRNRLVTEDGDMVTEAEDSEESMSGEAQIDDCIG